MNTSTYQLFNTPPHSLEKLIDLALDLRWTWSHSNDRLWNVIDPVMWELTHNPWLILQNISPERFKELAEDTEFQQEFQADAADHEEYLNKSGWFRDKYTAELKQPVAYFSMEFGLGEAIPLYAGGLGILAGDYLKTASDLNVPMVGIGLLYQEGYFRQTIDSNNWQVEMFPNSDPHMLPLEPSRDSSGAWLIVSLDLPGRTLLLRVWQAKLGKVLLYLLDSNVPLNSPSDRGITARLYEANRENRLLQEMVLGICGWRVLEALEINPQICHFNEGHAAFLVLERARRFMYQYEKSFPIALWATRAGNVFTTHTPVAAGFDTFSPELVSRNFNNYLKSLQISETDLLALGRQDPSNPGDPFNMAILAMRGSISVNGVSKLHGRTCRRLFQPLYPRWPEHEVPVKHITNGIHTPSWDSALSDDLWTMARGEKSWLDTLEPLASSIQRISDKDLWSFRSAQRQMLVNYVRQHLSAQLQLHGAGSEVVEKSQHILDPNALTMGFARRFTAYKRPNLLLHFREKLVEILINQKRPVQLIVSGKAHPQDIEGKKLIQDFLSFAQNPVVRNHVVFLEDYDMLVAENLVQGVDVWINTPRRPWEACGTSGMKVLVNGGLNFSEMDGWWAEAYSPEVGWAIGDSRQHDHDPEWDSAEAMQLYDILEHKIVPEFYSRDERGLPVQWISRIRSSMALLTPYFSTNRMLREYVEQIYLPVSQMFTRRLANNSMKAEELLAWQMSIRRSWDQIHIDNPGIKKSAKSLEFEAAVYLGEIDPAFVEVQVYAIPSANSNGTAQKMRQVDKIPGAVNGYLYRVSVSTSRPAEDFSIRVIPFNEDASIPLEDNHILWQR